VTPTVAKRQHTHTHKQTNVVRMPAPTREEERGSDTSYTHTHTRGATHTLLRTNRDISTNKQVNLHTRIPSRAPTYAQIHRQMLRQTDRQTDRHSRSERTITPNVRSPAASISREKTDRVGDVTENVHSDHSSSTENMAATMARLRYTHGASMQYQYHAAHARTCTHTHQ
jgi:hypothetical protein